MSQHDQVINNAAGATVLVDMNAAFGAIFSSSSGPIEPLVKQAGQLWFDTETAALKIRNAANSGWVAFTLGFNPADTYGKAEADAHFAQILTTYTKAQADARFAQTANTYTKAEVDAQFAAPLADTRFAPSAAPTAKAHFDFSAITAGQDRAIRVPDKPGLALGGWELIVDEDFGGVTSKPYLNLGAYHALWLVTDLYASANTAPIARLSSDNGATWLNTLYYYNLLYSYNNAATIYGGSGITAPQLYLAAGTVVAGAANFGCVSEYKLWGFNKPRWTCGIAKHAFSSSSPAAVGNFSMAGGHQSATAMNAISILALDGSSIMNGRVTLHGLRG